MSLRLSVFQGKEPKIEEFTPPGWYRDAAGAWVLCPAVNGGGLRKAGGAGQMETLVYPVPRRRLSPERGFKQEDP